MTHKANLWEHCQGVKPVLSKQGRWWKVTCPGCGKTVAYRQSECEAKQDWNAQIECMIKMKGQEDE